MEKITLCIFPLALLVLLFAGCKISKRGTFREDFFSLRDSKNLQIIAAFFIVLHHIVQRITNYGMKDIGPVGMLNDMGILFTGIFFFSSGYGLIVSMNSKENYLKGFLAKRLSAVLIPFYLANIVYFVAALFDGRLTNVKDIITSLLGYTLLNTNAWFIVEITIFYIAFYFIFRFVRKRSIALLLESLVAAAVIVLGIFLHHDATAIGGHWFRGEWWYNTTVLFILGLYFGEYGKKIFAAFKKIYVVLLPVMLGLVVLMYFVEYRVRFNYGYYNESFDHISVKSNALTCAAQTVYAAVFMLFILLLCMKIEFNNRVMKFLGAFSLELYLIHAIYIDMFIGKGMRYEFLILIVMGLGTVSAYILWLISKGIRKGIDFFWEKADGGETLEAEIKRRNTKRRLKLLIGLVLAAILVLIGLGVYSILDKYIFLPAEAGKEIETIEKANVGDHVFFGRYDPAKDSGGDRISWIVIGKEDGRAYLLAENILGNYPYDMGGCESYNDSELCEYLETKAPGRLFSQTEYDALVTNGNVEGKVFVPSFDELTSMEADNDTLLAKPTDAAIRRGASVAFSMNTGRWWLRDTGEDGYALSVSHFAEYEENRMNDKSCGIRPAIIVNFSK